MSTHGALHAEIALVIPSEMVLPSFHPAPAELTAELELFQDATGSAGLQHWAGRLDMLAWLAERVEHLGVGLVVPLAPELPAPRWAVELLLELTWGRDAPAPHTPQAGRYTPGVPSWAARMGVFEAMLRHDPALKHVERIVHIDPAYAHGEAAIAVAPVAAERGIGLTTHAGSLTAITANDVEALVASLTAAASGIDPGRVRGEWPAQDDSEPF